MTKPGALALAGIAPTVWSASSVTYALGPDALVVLIDAGDRPDGSAVQSVDEVQLRAPCPAEVVAVLTAGPRGLPIQGFVTTPDGCLPLGRLRITSHRVSHPPGGSPPRFEECQLRIDQRLPFSVLDRIRPVPAVALSGLDWLDLLPADPVGALRELVTGWFADIPAAAVVEPVGSVPSALAALYAAAGGRQEPLGGVNRIFTPDQFRSCADGRVVFGSECQGGWELLMDPTEPDPIVEYDDLGDGPIVERERLSGFLIQFAVCDAAVGSPYGGFATADSDTVRRLTAALRPIPLQPLRWPADPTHLYTGPGLAVAVCPAMPASSESTAPDLFEIYAGSRHRAALRPLRQAPVDWDHFTG